MMKTGTKPTMAAAPKFAAAMGIFVAVSSMCAAQGQGKDAPTNTTQNVAVVNTPTVNVGTMPAVSLVGTPAVTVSTSAAMPLSVRDADYANRRPYVLFQSGSVPSASGLYFGTFQIPNNTGKLFVIENLRFTGSMKGSDILMFCEVAITSTAATGGLPAMGQQNFLTPTIFSGYNAISATSYYSSQGQTLLYLLPGHNAAVSCTRGGPNGTLPAGDGTQEFVNFNLTGILVDVPAQ
jgi:hypothetical protein